MNRSLSFLSSDDRSDTRGNVLPYICHRLFGSANSCTGLCNKVAVECFFGVFLDILYVFMYVFYVCVRVQCQV